jgi:hypothetical protein
VGPVRLVLDTSAVVAFSHSNIDVGEVIEQVADERARFVVPVLCLAEGAAEVKADELMLVRMLAGHPCCSPSPLSTEWQALADGARVYGSVSRAAVAAAARANRGSYVLTTDATVYGTLPTIGVERN